MVTPFQVTGCRLYFDSQSTPTGFDDIFTRIEKNRAHYVSFGLEASYVKQLVI